MEKEIDYRKEMKLPEGKTCGDCYHIRQCRAFGFTSSEANTSCDFHPNRFHLALNWLDELKEGDRVYVSGRYNSILHTVDKVTKTQIVVSGNRYRKSSGTQCGDHGWHWQSLEKFTPEKEAEITKENRRSAIIGKLLDKWHGQSVRAMSNEQLETLHAAFVATGLIKDSRDDQ